VEYWVIDVILRSASIPHPLRFPSTALASKEASNQFNMVHRDSQEVVMSGYRDSQPNITTCLFISPLRMRGKPRGEVLIFLRWSPQGVGNNWSIMIPNHFLRVTQILFSHIFNLSFPSLLHTRWLFSVIGIIGWLITLPTCE
jgi:hypothetical protein